MYVLRTVPATNPVTPWSGDDPQNQELCDPRGSKQTSERLF